MASSAPVCGAALINREQRFDESVLSERELLVTEETKSFLRSSVVSLGLAASIIIAWCVSASLLDLSLFSAQKSGLLLEIGAVDGEVFSTREWWRLLTSQFLHVHFLHMLFNAGCIWLVGAFIEPRFGWWSTCSIYFLGGCVGQLASVMSYPMLVSSGASQALMALCGAALVLLSRRSQKVFVIALVVVQVALDFYVADKIKAGHSVGFVAGVVVGLVLFFGRVRSNRAVRSET